VAVPEVADVDACSQQALPPRFEADGSGARPALPGRTFESCSPIDLDGKPPCEIVCSLVAPAPDFHSGDDGHPPNFHMLQDTVYFAATRSPAAEIGRIVTYDGPLDAANAAHAAAHTTDTFVDHATSPPTLELRSASCLFQCNGRGPLSPLARPGAKSEKDCRAACPPTARYRYDGKRLRPVP
jgi:hypothetical protein